MAIIRPVTYAETDSRYRTVTDARGMGMALLTHCNPQDQAYITAAEAVLGLEEGAVEPEVAREAFVAALRKAGVFVRE